MSRHRNLQLDIVNSRPRRRSLADTLYLLISNKAVLQALFKIGDNKPTFPKTVEVVAEIEDATKVAKGTVYGSKASATTASVLKIGHKNKASYGQKQTISQPHLTLTGDRVHGVARRISLLKIAGS